MEGEEGEFKLHEKLMQKLKMKIEDVSKRQVTMFQTLGEEHY